MPINRKSKVSTNKKAHGPGNAYQPTKRDRDLVEELVAYGLTEMDICKFLPKADGEPISVPTLRKYFAEELRMGLHKANQKVAASLFKNATVEMSPAAQIFWLKTRARWRTTDEAPNVNVQVTNNTVNQTNYQPVERSIEQAQRIQQLAQKFLDTYIDVDYERVEEDDERKVVPLKRIK